MKLRIGLAQINVVPNQPARNAATILAYIKQARHSGLDLIAFGEMALPGYLIGDEWENDAFVRDCLEWNEQIRQASQGICVVWGSLAADFDKKGEDGRTRKYNAAFIAQNGQWLSNGPLVGQIYKTLLPSYREFEDKRHFYPLDHWAQEAGLSLGETLKPFTVNQAKIGLMLCEDMWDGDYALKPGSILEASGADLLLNLSCSPWTWRKNAKRHRVAKTLIDGAGIPLYYVNHTGIQNNGKDIYAFDGASTIYKADGGIAAMMPPYAVGILRSDQAEAVPPAGESRAYDERETLVALVQSLRLWFSAAGNPPVAIGLSGGIDSALVACLLAIALGPQRVWAVNMPSRFNSNTTKSAAAALARNLGINYSVIPIQESVDHTIGQIETAQWENSAGGPALPALSLSGLNRENIQARDRGGRIMAALASAIGGVFTNNGNKTETALGYATLYGDVNGALAPIGDLYKTQVYAMARLINAGFVSGELADLCGPELPGQSPAWSGIFKPGADGLLIPRAILDLVPSAELSEAQNVDEGKGDPIQYEYHDALLYQWIDGGYQENWQPAYGRRDPADILEWYKRSELDRRLGLPIGTVQRYFPDAHSFVDDLEHKWTVYKRSVFKRIQSPPIIALSKRAFGFDLRESSNGAYFTQAYTRLRESVLGGPKAPMP